MSAALVCDGEIVYRPGVHWSGDRIEKIDYPSCTTGFVQQTEQLSAVSAEPSSNDILFAAIGWAAVFVFVLGAFLYRLSVFSTASWERSK